MDIDNYLHPWYKQLYSYQQEGVAWLKEHPRSILADEMGLGKTMQVGAVLNFVKAKNVLILCRSILAYQWQSEMSKHYNQNVTIATRDDAKTLVICKEMPGWIVTNYAKLRVERFRSALVSRQWDAVIVDEATNISGRKSAQAQGLFDLSQNTSRIHFLTGTDMPNGSPAEMWWWLHCIDPKAFRGYWPFVNRYCDVEETEWGLKIVGAKDPTQLATMMNSYRLRREEADVGRFRPSLLSTRVMHPLSPKQRAMYTQMKKDFVFSTPATMQQASGVEGVEAQNTVDRFNKLRQICLTPQMFPLLSDDLGGKIEALDAIFDEAMQAGRKVVVFTWHRKFAQIIATHLYHRTKFQGWVIHGDQRPEDQYAACAMLNEDPNTFFLVGTIRSLGEGMNLQGASVIIFAERSYVPAHNLQAIKRVHREGQKRSVNVYGLVAQDTVEEWIVEITSDKQSSISEMELARRALEMEVKRGVKK